jgi:hypothetical protein
MCLTCLPQLLQLQQKHRALERRLRNPAPATGLSASITPTRATLTGKPSAQRTPVSQSKQPQQTTTKTRVAVAAVIEEEPGSPALSEITHSPDMGPSPAESPTHCKQTSMKAAAEAAATGGTMRAWPLVQQQQQAPGFMQEQAAAASWPALCAELEAEVETLKTVLASRDQEVVVGPRRTYWYHHLPNSGHLWRRSNRCSV